MSKIERFENIRAWRFARQLVNQVYQATSKPGLSKDFGLRDQIRRASGSVMHNIAEGFDAGSDAEFLRFLGYARRSASEVQSQLYTALDQAYLTKDEFETIYEQATQTKRLINAFIGYLAKSKKNSKISEEGITYSADELAFEDLIDFSDPLDPQDHSDHSD